MSGADVSARMLQAGMAVFHEQSGSLLIHEMLPEVYQAMEEAKNAGPDRRASKTPLKTAIDDEMVERAVKAKMGREYEALCPAAAMRYERAKVREILEAALNPEPPQRFNVTWHRRQTDCGGTPLAHLRKTDVTQPEIVVTEEMLAGANKGLTALDGYPEADRNEWVDKCRVAMYRAMRKLEPRQERRAIRTLGCDRAIREHRRKGEDGLLPYAHLRKDDK